MDLHYNKTDRRGAVECRRAIPLFQFHIHIPYLGTPHSNPGVLVSGARPERVLHISVFAFSLLGSGCRNDDDRRHALLCQRGAMTTRTSNDWTWKVPRHHHHFSASWFSRKCGLLDLNLLGFLSLNDSTAGFAGSETPVGVD